MRSWAPRAPCLDDRLEAAGSCHVPLQKYAPPFPQSSGSGRPQAVYAMEAARLLVEGHFKEMQAGWGATCLTHPGRPKGFIFPEPAFASRARCTGLQNCNACYSVD